MSDSERVKRIIYSVYLLGNCMTVDWLASQVSAAPCKAIADKKCDKKAALY